MPIKCLSRLGNRSTTQCVREYSVKKPGLKKYDYTCKYSALETVICPWLLWPTSNAPRTGHTQSHNRKHSPKPCWDVLSAHHQSVTHLMVVSQPKPLSCLLP